MQTLDVRQVTCQVLTLKAGVLAGVGHDLQLRATCTILQIGGQPRRLQATFAAQTMAVVCAMKAGQPLPDALSPRDCKEIERNLAKQVLRSAAFPEIRFVSEPLDAGLLSHVRGELTLVGKTRRIEGEVQQVGDQIEARVDLDQRDFGIEPFSAMFGALRVRPVVRIVLSAPARLFAEASA